MTTARAETPEKLPLETVRGRIMDYLDRQQPRMVTPILEVGSKLPHAHCWWADNRARYGSGLDWLGIDQSEGTNVDQVADVELLPFLSGRFGTVICSEVLEHVRRPWLAAKQMARVLRPGGFLIVTTLMSFPEHGYPNDYWRYTPQGLETLLSDAGLVDVEVESAGKIEITLDDHGGRVVVKSMPIHVFATGRKP